MYARPASHRSIPTPSRRYPHIPCPRPQPLACINDLWLLPVLTLLFPIVSNNERARYTDIIDGILADADLETISRKKIRQGLEASLGGKDLSEQKEAIKDLIVSRFDAISSNAEATQEPESSPQKRAATNGVSDHGSTDPSASPEPARKKAKRSSSVEDADARLAAQLQAQENSLARGRSTRGGGEKKVTKKKAPRKKSAKKVKSDDDSDVDASDASGTTRKRKAGGGFQKPFMLSPALSELTGETQVC